MDRTKSKELFEKAKTYFPGGVNSPVRAFKSVDGNPLFIERGDGCRMWDEDGNEFIDFCSSWGPLILGHNNPFVNKKIKEAVNKGTSFGTPTRLENELAELIISNNRYIEMLRMVNSGTEATMSAIRLARGFTGRNKIIKFDGCYHGHSDGLLVKAGSGLATLGTSSSAGIPENYTKETIVLPLNNQEVVEKAVAKYRNEIACIIIEPIPANNGLLLQGKEYLSFLRDVCTREKILLFFDEVISGFRVGFEGAAGYYNIQPDLLTYGKIIGGGLPVGAYGASKKIMMHISPEGPVYQAGTLSGNPVAMAAGIAQLLECLRPGFYEKLASANNKFCDAIIQHALAKGFRFSMPHIASIFWITFSDKPALSADTIPHDSADKFKILHRELLQKGIYVGPSGFEVGFISAAMTTTDLEYAAKAFCEALDVVYN